MKGSEDAVLKRAKVENARDGSSGFACTEGKCGNKEERTGQNPSSPP